MNKLKHFAFLAILLNINAQTKTLTLQPGPVDGIDALVCNRVDMINSNFPNDTRLQIVGWTGSSNGSPDQDWRTYIKFSGLDLLKEKQAKVSRARLTLYGRSSNYFGETGNNAGKIYLVNGPWGESQITWNTQPAFNSQISVATPKLGIYDSVVVDVTVLVSKIVEGGAANYGFLHKLDVEDPYTSLEYHSSDYTVANKRPKLSVEYEEPLPNQECRKVQPDGTAGKDAMVCNRLDMINSNYGTHAALQVVGWTGSSQGSSDQDWRAFLQFSELDAFLDPNMSVQSAYVTLYAPSQKYFTSSGNNASRLHLITEPWTETSITWNNQPDFLAENFISIPAKQDNFDSIRVDVTSLVLKMKELGLENNGFVLKLAAEDPYNSIEFLSSDAPNGNRRPKFEICGQKIATEACNSFQPAIEGKDAMISNRLDMINSNYGTHAALQAVGWTGDAQGSPDQDWRFLLQFSQLDSYIAAKKAVNQVSLTLYSTQPRYFPELGDNMAKLHLVTSPWTESTVTWNSQPTFSASSYVSVPAQEETYDSVQIDITNLVNTMISQQLPNYGFLFKLVAEDPYRSIEFQSSDASNAQRRPKLSICADIITTLVDQNQSVATLFPNPTKDMLYVNRSGGFKAYTVYNSVGVQVMQGAVQGDGINMGHLPQGIYTLMLMGTSENLYQKVVKE
ncbi:MAG TPA: DNRLRE domain-containing protein [Cytophagales bacterium]|nr:DNRLRE domain-containing protein [Cytophagales bacterium]